MTDLISDDERRARLARRHLLVDPTDDVVAITDALVAVHSSDPATVYLTYWSRLREPSVEAVDAALFGSGRLLRHHGMRRTLWVTTLPVARAVHSSTTLDLVTAEHRRQVKDLTAAGVPDPEAWIAEAGALIVAALAEHGPLSARELGRVLPDLSRKVELAAGTSYAVVAAAHTRLLTLLGFEGRIVRERATGSWVASEYRWTLPAGDLALDAVEPRAAAAALAASYVARYGPVTTEDVSWWAGWTKARTRQALADARVREVRVSTGPAWVAADDETPADPGPWVAVLPSLDATSMGWWGRAWYLPPTSWDAFDMGQGVGNAGPTIWVDGRIVGAWAQRPDGELVTHYFEAVAAARRREVDERLKDVRGWVGSRVVRARFPGRIQAALLARP